LLVLITLQGPPPVHGCGVAYRGEGRITPVEIASESAIILWDAASKTQHFIRRASFKTRIPDFGFLVPTPTEPKLSAARDEAFDSLAKITAPRIIKEKRPTGGGGCVIGCGSAKAPGAAETAVGKVEVLQQKRVGGFDTAVLKANDAKALQGWLEKHDYVFTPDLLAWVEPYVKAGWIITAFKIAKDSPESMNVATTAVRMTFQTERPFYPYREPEDQRRGGKLAPRLLRVFFLGESRMDGTLGKTGELWPGKVVWANKVSAAQRTKLLEVLDLPEETPPATWYLTEFEDRSSPRPGTDDVFFAPSEDQQPVERPPSIIYVSAPLPDVMMCALVACLVGPWLLRRWRRGGSATV
jgi:hypothetical protein